MADTTKDPESLATRCVHGGWRPDARRPGVTLPIDRSTTFRLDDQAYRVRAEGQLEQSRVYSRESGPTLEAVETHLASLEGASRAALFASGMAALHAAVLGLAEGTGRRLLAASALYGGSRGLLVPLADRLGLEFGEFDPRSPESLLEALDERPALVLVESLSNPSLVVADLPSLAQATHQVGGLLLVDATFVSPILQRPLEHGADLVWHSATKFLGGHSDLLAGVLAGSAERVEPCRRWRTLAGAAPDPQAAWLLWRGMRTLHLRLRESSATASELAQLLSAHPGVSAVRHPSRFDGREQELAQRLLDLPGSMLTFDVVGGDARVPEVCARLRLIVEAASLGGVETLISPPSRMSHVGQSREQLAAAGIGDGCLRLSVGIEDAGDLWSDLAQALGTD